jgi:putative nucleotidyltransferase with HDIG domain
MAHILIVDDEEQIRRFLNRMLTRQGYQCTLSADVAEAREILKERSFELILCDINMPGESGIELARHVGSEYKDTAVIMVTGVDDPLVADGVMMAGAYGYIIKPFDTNEIIINVRNALRRRELEITNREYRENLERVVEERTSSLQKTLHGIIYAMSLAVESRDPYTSGHQRRVSILAAAIAEEMGLSKNQIEGIRLAGLIHDLGKIAIPAEVLSKTSSFTDIEYALIKTHSQIGHDILKDIEFPWPIAEILLQHHEKIDGSGYPMGMCGEEILLEARIMCVADVVEAMASHRPYRPAVGLDKALEEVANNRGKLYDVNVVKACLTLFREKGFSFDR